MEAPFHRIRHGYHSWRSGGGPRQSLGLPSTPSFENIDLLSFLFSISIAFGSLSLQYLVFRFDLRRPPHRPETSLTSEKRLSPCKSIFLWHVSRTIFPDIKPPLLSNVNFTFDYQLLIFEYIRRNVSCLAKDYIFVFIVNLKKYPAV